MAIWYYATSLDRVREVLTFAENRDVEYNMELRSYSPIDTLRRDQIRTKEKESTLEIQLETQEAK